MYHNAQIVHWMNNKNTHTIIPAHVDIDLSNICNQDCYYCNSAEFRKKVPSQKKYKDYIKLLDQLANWRKHSPMSYGTLNSISFTGGGEPTLLPKYEKVIEHAIDLGFLVSLTTNASKLANLITNIDTEKIKKMAWIGIDIDAGNEDTYEKIRRSLTRKSIFQTAIANAQKLVDIGANVDFKILVDEKNSSLKELESIFKIGKKVGARIIYFRPVIINGKLFNLTTELIQTLDYLSIQYSQEYKINTTKSLERTYSRCHQMFQFPVFCADGNVYTCCENRGNANFCIGSWIENDVRDFWCKSRHMDIYNKINTKLCKPCRPNANNIEIQKIINDSFLLGKLFV